MYLPFLQCLEENPDFNMQMLVSWLHSKWQR